jgi:SAM-dependent methyltransferase
MGMEEYSERFYKEHQKTSLDSADVIVPIVISLIKPKSVLDVGCGTGAWLSTFQKKGINDILGIDGKWVNKSRLIIPKEKFVQMDLKKPSKLNRKFELALSLEVAEHLPESCADRFIDFLASASQVILFSAAIPFQGGTNHSNEKWQDYWAEKFEKRGYQAIDCIRSKVWSNKRVSFFYAQNMILFVKKDAIDKHPALKKELHCKTPFSIVHPERYLLIAKERNVISNLVPAPLKKLRLLALRLFKKL